MSRRRPDEHTDTANTPQRPALRAVDGPVLRTSNHTWMWFKLPAARWNFLANDAREAMILQLADQLAELQGHWLHLRVTYRPESPHQWARAHHALAPAEARLPDIPGGVTFDQYLAGEQQAMAGALLSKEVYLGVLLSSRSLLDRAVAAAPAWLRHRAPRLAGAELSALSGERERVEHALAHLGATPATAEDMDWLLTRSFALGLPTARPRPVPAETQSVTDLDSYTDLAQPVQEPYAPSVTLRGQGPLAGHDRSVVVLTLGLTQQRLAIPDSADPWMAQADRLGVPVEWSARFYIRGHDAVAGELHHQMDKVRAQVRHYTDDHGLPPPMQLDRQRDLVQEIEDELSSGITPRGTRVRGWWRVAIPGEDEQQALERARELADLYRPAIRLEHPNAQAAHAQEFIPGEPIASPSYVRRGSVVWAAAGMAHVTAAVGDRQGVILGETVTRSTRPVAWDPWLSQAQDSSGLTGVVAGLGGGKSVLSGMLCYKTLRLGARWVVLDPSGPLARLTRVPELAPHARAINLLDAAPGTLNPFRLVADPAPEHYADEADPDSAWRHATVRAAATRRRLVLDTLTGLLPYEVQQMSHTRMVLMRAIRAVGGHRSRHIGHVLAQLRADASSQAEHAHNLADLLDEVGERLQLLIPDRNAVDDGDERDWRLTVLTMPGLTMPHEGTPRAEWDAQEQESVVLLNLAAWLTQRSVYDRSMTERKGVLIDEAAFLGAVSTGRVLMNRFARDSRKWNLRVLLSSQLPADLTRIQDGIETLLDSVVVGHLNGATARSQALELLRAPTDHGYDAVFDDFPTGRSTDVDPARHFLFRDSNSAVERLRADYSAPHLAHVLAALDTTPGGGR